MEKPNQATSSECVCPGRAFNVQHAQMISSALRLLMGVQSARERRIVAEPLAARMASPMLPVPVTGVLEEKVNHHTAFVCQRENTGFRFPADPNAIGHDCFKVP
jgi:hypothetical protein